MALQAVITGSTSGIGWGLARAFAADGYDITLNGIADSATVEKLLVELRTEFKVQANYSPANMAKPSEIREMISQVEARAGAVDVLVITPEFNMSHRLKNFRKTSGTLLLRSTCRARSTPRRRQFPR